MTRWAYHLTYQQDLPSIARSGMRVQRDVEEAWDNEPAIYFVSVLGLELGPQYDPEYSAWVRFPWPADAKVPAPGDTFSEHRTRLTVPAAEIEVLMKKNEFLNSMERGAKWVPLIAMRFGGRRRA